MKKLLLLIGLVFTFMISSYAFSIEIKPFGFTLGSQLENKYYKDLEMYPSGVCMKVEPILPNTNFSNYKVCISPSSHTIFRVIASTNIHSNEQKECSPFHEDFKEIILKKYNLPIIYNDGFEPSPFEYKSILHIKDNSTSIETMCHTRWEGEDFSYYSYYLNIVYELVSEEIKTLRKKEEIIFIDERKNQLDTQGL
jgi:hypothetical protein